MKIQHRLIALDSADLAEESNFWAQVLGGTVDTWDESHMVVVEGQPQIGVQLVPDHVRPEWPKGMHHRIRIDLWVEDPVPSHELVMSLGARVLDEPEDDPAMGIGCTRTRRATRSPCAGESRTKRPAASAIGGSVATP